MTLRRVLLENSSYGHRNAGDAAMLRAAVDRLRGFFDGAEVRVLTTAPDQLRDLCPTACPVDLTVQPPGFTRSLVPIRWRRGRRFQEAVRCRADEWAGRLGRWSDRLAGLARAGMPAHRAAFARYLAELDAADLVVATGGGFVTDAFPHHCRAVLMTLLLAAGRGKPVAMTGQGLGPLTSRPLTRLARAVFPRLAVVGLREGVASPALATALGAPADRVVVTGDDAVEFAYSLRPDALGGAVGVNLRVARYSGVSDGEAGGVRAVVLGLAERASAPVLPVPISWYPQEDDLGSFRRLFPGVPVDPAAAAAGPDPDATARLAGRCRVVVTGSYHAGVFALAQGVPVVGLAKSAYYVDKFEGLAGQFPDGVRVARLDDPAGPAAVAKAAEDLWAAAPGLRAGLLASAAAQVEAGRAFYRRLALLGRPDPGGNRR